MDNALQFLLEQSRQREEKAMLALGKSRQELEGYYHQISQLEQYRIDYCNQLIERGKRGLTASEYSHLNRFLTQLDETLAKQRSAEGYFKDQVRHCEEHWFEVRKQRRSYEWLMEKKRQERQHIEAKREQKESDEFASLQYARHKNEND
jgi:flagellar protein FliJ